MFALPWRYAMAVVGHGASGREKAPQKVQSPPVRSKNGRLHDPGYSALLRMQGKA
jgi:hypothetical protein